MAGVGKGQRADFGVDHAVEEADEAVLRDAAAEDPIDLLAELRRLGGVGRESPDGRLQVRHQQRRGDALADDVSDGEAEAGVAEAG